jgi:hypothetical protein
MSRSISLTDLRGHARQSRRLRVAAENLGGSLGPETPLFPGGAIGRPLDDGRNSVGTEFAGWPHAGPWDPTLFPQQKEGRGHQRKLVEEGVLPQQGL